jgi:hypothetical protein
MRASLDERAGHARNLNCASTNHNLPSW